MIQTICRLFRRPPPQAWRESRLVSPDGIIYIVRDAPGREREVCDAPGRECEVCDAWCRTWTPESRAQFSSLPCFEEYHRQQYRAARPYTKERP